MSTLITLSDRYFGDVEAHDEASLHREYFNLTYVSPSSISPTSLRNDKKFIIVGRKGAGKSALQMRMISDLEGGGWLTHQFRFFYDLRSDDYSEISQTQSEISFASVTNERNLFLHYDFRDVWERVFFERIAETLKSGGFSSAFTKFVSPANGILKNIFDGITKNLKVSLKGNVGVAEVKAEIDVGNALDGDEISLKKFNQITRALAKECHAGYRMYFFIDELVFS